MSANFQSSRIVVIDRLVEGYRSLVDAAKVSGLEVFLLSDEGDGILELGQMLAGRSGIEEIHLISHGGEGTIQLGRAQLSNDNLDQYADVLETIKSSLAEGGDLLIYGCNVASSESGEQFVTALSQRVNADVAASNDLTGHADLGGDWDLEFKHGEVAAVGDWLWSVQDQFRHLGHSNAEHCLAGKYNGRLDLFR